MTTRVWDLQRIGLGGGVLLVLSAVALVALAGCERKLEPGETYHKQAVAWPIFDVEKTEGIEDGLQWKREKGDAAFWLASWNRLHKFNKSGSEVYRKERKTFIPFYSVNVEESDQFKKTWGIILLYPYNSYRTKDASGAFVPPRSDDK